ncbi:membrane fusion protein, Cu(I)/Ag(I) efflux system [Mariprofundus micogutta]|uniref:Membrane fusion protein, Cu(I)/Ag(I) efflux system n=1 Tax=Mariprofundus micogutta TaxID=1921010 RepID=A0A1L8CP65_9PROT|nr:efflux RND transporter periplasmic adaptor subunit [Mariprofundus micogutta]GAV20673.1 membrane fusion protein, Cu(I)/Ag(I) efflux system [Mariprofundus micogutta]
MKRMMIFIPAILLMAVITAYWIQTKNADTEARPSNTANVASATFYDANPFKVRAVLKPETPKVGKNHVTIFVQDETGKPVSGATLKAVAVMPSMGSMPAMYAPAAMKESVAGKYEGEFTPTMSGSWPLAIDINAKGKKGSITFDLATGRKGLRCTTCGDQVTAIPGIIRVDPDRRQLIGVTTRHVKRKTLRVTIRAAGTIAYDETRLSDVSMKFNGWVGDIYADSIGKPITKGDVLFTVYSPELLAAQGEYLEALRRVHAKGGNRKGLLEAGRRRLSLWSMTPSQIRTLEKRGKAQDYVPILAPESGVVIEKQILTGSAFKTGQRLLRIANLSRVWVEAQVYDYELPLINTGMKVKVTLPDIQDREFEGKVDYIYPFMENDTRTARVRVVLDNTDGFLRPDMYAQVKLRVNMGKRLLVPESAVIYAGEARVVFLDIGDGRLQPRKIKTGQRNRHWIEVIGGLKAGDTVVTSGNFLIAAESKLKSGLAQW